MRRRARGGSGAKKRMSARMDRGVAAVRLLSAVLVRSDDIKALEALHVLCGRLDALTHPRLLLEHLSICTPVEEGQSVGRAVAVVCDEPALDSARAKQLSAAVSAPCIMPQTDARVGLTGVTCLLVAFDLESGEGRCI